MRKRKMPILLFGLISILLPIAIYFSMQLPLVYKAVLPAVSVLLYTLLIIRIFNFARIPTWITILTIIIVLAAAYFTFPTYHDIQLENTNGEPIHGKITVSGEYQLEKTGQRIKFCLPRGKYTITYTGEQRETVEQEKDYLLTPMPVTEVIRLAPGIYTYEKTKFLDPYKVKELYPEVSAEGTDLDGHPVQIKGSKNLQIPYGEVKTTFTTTHFSRTMMLTGNITELVLMPNENTVILTKQEADWIKNYMKMYLELSAQKIIQQEGFPKQYHLFAKDYTLGLGDMLFVICEMEQPNASVFYVLKNQQYVKRGATENCYTSLLDGQVPIKIKDQKAEQSIYDQLSNTVRTINYDFGELNQKKHALDWAISYDIEYGRYVPREGISDTSFSTCSVAPEYLSGSECNNPDFSGWVTQSAGTWWYNEYNYPVSSGMLGWRYILELSNNYGIPTTDYIVTKDLDLFNKKDPLLVDLSKNLAQEGLVEIGSQTVHHTRLDKVFESVAKDELGRSRGQLQEFYGVNVTGARTPYLSLVNGKIEDTEKVLAETGYKYYSLYGEPRKVRYIDMQIEHKPINFFGYLGYSDFGHLDEALRTLPYVISLDHPWNILFRETATDQGVKLEEAPEQPVRELAIILEAMSRGVWFTTVQKIEVK